MNLIGISGVLRNSVGIRCLAEFVSTNYHLVASVVTHSGGLPVLIYARNEPPGVGARADNRGQQQVRCGAQISSLTRLKSGHELASGASLVRNGGGY